MSTRAARSLVVAGAEPSWSSALAGVTRCDPERVAEEDPSAFDVAFIDGSDPRALGTARRLRTLDDSLQPVVVTADDEERARVERSLLFTPGIGELWVVTPRDVGAALATRAAGVTAQRRGFRATRRAVATRAVGDRHRAPEREQVSDVFLAALLEVLPDPVLSLDGDGCIVSLNPAAERVLGRTAVEAAGHPAGAVLRPANPAQLDALLESGRSGPVRGEVTLLRDGEPGRTAEVAVAPADAAGHRVRVLLLRDVTQQLETQAELEAQASQLESAAAELEMLNQGLAERTAELESAQATRNRFYAAMSHELRTPINAIIGYDDLILDGLFGPLDPRQEKALRRGRRAAGHLLELVNDVLDLSKVEAGRIDLEVEATNIQELLTELLDTVRPMAEQDGVELRLACEPCPIIATDPRRLRQIVLNLLSNAIRFGAGRPVEVGARAIADDRVEIWVRDRGDGIAPEDHGRIFEEFVQLAGGGRGGTGLGLPISRRLAELLGGELTVASEPGVGSTFTFALPHSIAGT